MKTMKYTSLSPNIGVKNVVETVQFYTEILGFNLTMSVPSNDGFEGLQWAMLQNGNSTIMFQEINNLKNEYPELENRSEIGLCTFYITMKNSYELYEKIKNTKYLAHDMNKTFYGADEFAIYDNNGYILTITEDNSIKDSIKNYDNFFLPANDFLESVHFYENLLGLEKKFVFLEKGMIAFKIGKEEPAIILKDKAKMPDTIPTIWLEVEDVAAIYEMLKIKGVQFLSAPFRIHTGWAVEFNDPSGNRLGFTDYKK